MENEEDKPKKNFREFFRRPPRRGWAKQRSRMLPTSDFRRRSNYNSEMRPFDRNAPREILSENHRRSDTRSGEFSFENSAGASDHFTSSFRRRTVTPEHSKTLRNVFSRSMRAAHLNSAERTESSVTTNGSPQQIDVSEILLQKRNSPEEEIQSHVFTSTSYAADNEQFVSHSNSQLAESSASGECVLHPEKSVLTAISNVENVSKTSSSSSISKLCSPFSLLSVLSKRNVDSAKVRNQTEPKNRREILILQLQKNEVECIICCSIIRREVAIWHCSICYQIFHLFCIKKWSNSEHSEENKADQKWRCPTCQYMFGAIPNKYYCFCGKQKNPPVSNYTIPHGCGELCGKYRTAQNKDCNHPCTEVCHPGPCPPCSVLVKTTCKCGKLHKPQQCSLVQEWSCRQECGKMLSCRNHYCEEICHSGACKMCSVQLKQRCFSHGKENVVACSSEYTSDFECGEMCGKAFECGVHYCQRKCHPGSCGKCLFDPEFITRCCCGRYTIEELKVERKKCTDPLVKCGSVCNKALPCGNGEHRCKALCHEGSCSCDLETIAVCKCFKKNKVILPCTQILRREVVEISCNQVCGKRKTCGRHTCTNVCCTLSDGSEHICLLKCNRKLLCGIHVCQELCHKGKCNRCAESRFEDWTCECGRTTLCAPIPCGTKLPDCKYPCSRTHSCDHPVMHNCHREPTCPPCVYLVDKTCMCRKSVIHNVQCFIKDVSCGSLCGKILPCGFHTCKRSCHLGECLAVGEKCTQPCEALRKACGHPCALPCHGNTECPESVCLKKLYLKCACGRKAENTVCRITSKPLSHERSLTSTLFTPNSQEVASVKQILEARKLECDDECAHQIRLKNLAVALKIDPSNPTFTGVTYNDFLKEFGRKQAAFMKGVEEKFAALVSDTIRRQCVYNTVRFSPVGWTKRRFIHELAPIYGCSTYSEGKEPNRYVTAACKFGYCWIPSRSLSETLSYEKRVPPPVTLLPTEKDDDDDDQRTDRPPSGSGLAAALDGQ